MACLLGQKICQEFNFPMKYEKYYEHFSGAESGGGNQNKINAKFLSQTESEELSNC